MEVANILCFLKQLFKVKWSRDPVCYIHGRVNKKKVFPWGFWQITSICTSARASIPLDVFERHDQILLAIFRFYTILGVMEMQLLLLLLQLLLVISVF